MLITLVFAALPALAAPPSSTLSGPSGSLTWTVTEAAGEVRIAGRSPAWSVEHVAGPDLLPRRTTRTDADGTVVTVTYDAGGATVTRAGRATRIDAPGAWDGDTLDVRLGAAVAAGRRSFTLDAVDSASAKVYSFVVSDAGTERCGASDCSHARVQLSGMLRYVGPTWDLWFAGDGRLLRFEGPIGAFTAAGSR